MAHANILNNEMVDDERIPMRDLPFAARIASKFSDQIKQLSAARHQIPVVQNRSLARRLFHDVDFNQHVPPHLYADVARIMIWIMSMRKAKQTSIARSIV